MNKPYTTDELVKLSTLFSYKVLRGELAVKELLEWKASVSSATYEQFAKWIIDNGDRRSFNETPWASAKFLVQETQAI